MQYVVYLAINKPFRPLSLRIVRDYTQYTSDQKHDKDIHIKACHLDTFISKKIIYYKSSAFHQYVIFVIWNRDQILYIIYEYCPGFCFGFIYFVESYVWNSFNVNKCGLISINDRCVYTMTDTYFELWVYNT